MQRIIVATGVASLVIQQRVPTPLTQELAATEHGITVVTYGPPGRWSIMSRWRTACRTNPDTRLVAGPHSPTPTTPLGSAARSPPTPTAAAAPDPNDS